MSDDDGSAKPGRMNLWGVPLDDLDETKRVKVTCSGGMPVQDFAVDPETLEVTLVVGGSLYTLASSEVEVVLSGSATPISPVQREGESRAFYS